MKNDDGNYRMENGEPKLVRMTDTVNGHLTVYRVAHRRGAAV